MKKEFTVYDVLAAGYNLEPLACRACGSREVVFNQYVGDASCQNCGSWQLGECGDTVSDDACIFCGAETLVYHEAVGDTYCPWCGKWQDNGES